MIGTANSSEINPLRTVANSKMNPSRKKKKKKNATSHDLAGWCNSIYKFLTTVPKISSPTHGCSKHNCYNPLHLEFNFVVTDSYQSHGIQSLFL